MSRTAESIRAYVRSVTQQGEHAVTNPELDAHIRQAFREMAEYAEWPFLWVRKTLSVADVGNNRRGYLLPPETRVRSMKSVWTTHADGSEDRKLEFSSHNDAIERVGWTHDGSPARWSYLPSPRQDSTDSPAGIIFTWPSGDTDVVVDYVSEVEDWPTPSNSPSVPPTPSQMQIPSGLMTAVEFLSVANFCLQKEKPEMGRSFYSKGRQRLQEHRDGSFPTENVVWSMSDGGSRYNSRPVRVPYSALPR